MSEKHPLKIILSNFVPRDILSDLRDRIQNQDWNSFFTSLVGVGSVAMMASLGCIILVVLLSRAISGTIDPVRIIFNIITNITLIATIGYVLVLLTLNGIKSTVEGEPAFTEQETRVVSYFDFDRERIWVQFGKYTVNVIISFSFIALIIVFRSGLVLSTDIVGTATGFQQKSILILVVVGLDLAYLGLVLILVGQLYETVKSLRRLAD
ncbi:hypothetical protein GWK26_00605 [haloarchaeon 3A1-DGR]|nr:hypothetical protein GWK26_00605 [haloarchaeon 3A1-DGR]